MVVWSLSAEKVCARPAPLKCATQLPWPQRTRVNQSQTNISNLCCKFKLKFANICHHKLHNIPHQLNLLKFTKLMTLIWPKRRNIIKSSLHVFLLDYTAAYSSWLFWCELLRIWCPCLNYTETNGTKRHFWLSKHIKNQTRKQKKVCKNLFRTDFFLFLSVECLVY